MEIVLSFQCFEHFRCICVCVCVCVYVHAFAQSFSHIRLLATPWTIAYQASLSMGFPRQEYWSGLPLPSPGDLPDPGIKPVSPASACGFFTTEPPGKPFNVSTFFSTWKLFHRGHILLGTGHSG